MRGSVISSRSGKYYTKAILSAAIATAALGAMDLSAGAALFTYNNVTTGTTEWSPSGASWSSSPNPPTSALDTTLTFSGTLVKGVNVISDDNIAGNFQLNQLNMNYKGPASGAAPTVTISGSGAGTALDFVNNGGTGPTLNFNNPTSAIVPTLTLSINVVLDNTLTISGTSNATLSGIISGGSGLAMSGSNTITVSNANTYTGATTLDAGIFKISTLAAGGTASGIGQSSAAAGNLVFGGGTLQYNGSTAFTTDRLFTIGDANGNSATISNAGTATNGISFTNTGSVLFGTTGTHILSFAGSQNPGSKLPANSQFDPLIADYGPGGPSNATTVNKSGASAWTLNNTNTYSGGTNVTGGVLEATVVGAFGSGVITVNGGVVYLNSTSGTTFDNLAFSIAGDGPTEEAGSSVPYTAGDIMFAAGVTLGFNSTITLTADSRITALGNPAGTTVATINASITGTGALTFFNGGEVGQSAIALGSASNSNKWTGDTILAGIGNTNGNLYFVMGNNNVLPYFSMPGGTGTQVGNFVVTNNGQPLTVNLNGYNETINGLSNGISSGPLIAGNMTLNPVITNTSATPSASVLTLGDNNATAAYIGTITGSATQTVGLTKIGSGTQTLAGSTSYYGNTTVTSGTLSLDYSLFASSSSSTPSNYFTQNSAIILNGGTLAIVGRSNSPGANTTAASSSTTKSLTVTNATGLVVGQTINVDTFSPYIVSISGNVLTLNSAVTVNSGDAVTASATAASTSQTFASFAVTASSGLDFGTGGATTLTFGSVTHVPGTTLTIYNWQGIPNTGMGTEQLLFTGLTTDFTSIFNASDVIFGGYGPGYQAIQEGTVYEIVPTTVPEPASLALLGLGAAGLLMRRRRA